ncbi:hypothetical protein GSbR_20200 [Geobacter sp. SVR]|nr:hypothetical protein GSVR_17610 [Geobacter sp. SVR]GCF85420.1 hypothetical protein GSbR_20200 [Geobacter sp. SVR]
MIPGGHPLVPLRIDARDVTTRNNAKAAGGRWNPEKLLGFVRYGNVLPWNSI